MAARSCSLPRIGAHAADPREVRCRRQPQPRPERRVRLVSEFPPRARRRAAGHQARGRRGRQPVGRVSSAERRVRREENWRTRPISLRDSVPSTARSSSAPIADCRLRRGNRARRHTARRRHTRSRKSGGHPRTGPWSTARASGCAIDRRCVASPWPKIRRHSSCRRTGRSVSSGSRGDRVLLKRDVNTTNPNMVGDLSGQSIRPQNYQWPSFH